MEPTALERAGLYDPQAEDAADRLALLQYSLAQGVTLDELVEADRVGRLGYVAADPLVRGTERRVTVPEAASATGIAEATIRRIWRAAGFVDPGDGPAVKESELAVFRLFLLVAALLGEEETLQLIRVLGSAMARVTEAEVAAITSSVGQATPSARGQLETAVAATALAAALPDVAVVLDLLHRRHVEASIRRLTGPLLSQSEADRRLAVGFVDLVGSTSLAHELGADELGEVLASFETRALEAVAGAGGRVVKLIGDEVMFVAPDAAVACDVATAVATSLGSDPRLPQVRGGLAIGPLLIRDGDYYGPVVNLAARIVKEAAPGQILVSADIGAALGRDLASVGTRKLKGFDTSVELFDLPGPAPETLRP